MTWIGRPTVLSAAAPSRMATDANTWALWKFAPASGTTITNDGAGGSTLDLALNSTTKFGDYYDWIVDPRAIFGKCLSLLSNNASSTAGAPRWASTSTSGPSGTSFTLSAIVTPLHLGVPFSWANIFGKMAAGTGTWASPFYTTSLGFSSVGAVSQIYVGKFYAYMRSTANNAADTLESTKSMTVPAFYNRVTTIVYTHTYGSAAKRLYVNGTLIASDLSTVTGGTPDFLSGPWWVGADSGNHCEYMSGLYHEARICTTARSAAWALEHYKRANGLPL